MIYKLKKVKDKFVEKVYKESMKDLDKFYKVGWTYGKPSITITQSRKEIDELKDIKTESWDVGWSDNRMVYVLDFKKMGKESERKYSKEAYEALIKHELSHAFYNIISKGNYNPRWLCEGVAIYTSGQNKFKKFPTKFVNFLNYYNKGGSGIYYESGFVVYLLVKKYGKNKLLKLISNLDKVKNKQDFSKLFKKIYGFDLNYKNFNNLLKLNDKS